jgi:hypothetical protein
VPYTEVDERISVVLETSEELLTPLTSTYIENVRRTWRFLEYIRSHARPGWWTLKRWVEFMWFRKEVA